jgi:hypothetical protein
MWLSLLAAHHEPSVSYFIKNMVTQFKEKVKRKSAEFAKRLLQSINQSINQSIKK